MKKRLFGPQAPVGSISDQLEAQRITRMRKAKGKGAAAIKTPDLQAAVRKISEASLRGGGLR